MTGTESLTVGDFTLSETVSSSHMCSLPVLRDDSQVAAVYAAGVASAAVPLPAGASTTAITHSVDTFNNEFSAVRIDGGGEVYGDISDITTSTGCVIAGSVLGG